MLINSSTTESQVYSTSSWKRQKKRKTSSLLSALVVEFDLRGGTSQSYDVIKISGWMSKKREITCTVVWRRGAYLTTIGKGRVRGHGRNWTRATHAWLGVSMTTTATAQPLMYTHIRINESLERKENYRHHFSLSLYRLIGGMGHAHTHTKQHNLVYTLLLHCRLGRRRLFLFLYVIGKSTRNHPPRLYRVTQLVF